MNLEACLIYSETFPFWTRPSGKGFDEDSSFRYWKSSKETFDDFWAVEVISRREVLAKVKEEVIEVYQECSFDNWDNYGARSINPVAVEEALWLINQLDSNIVFPYVVPEPNGGIGLEWRKGSSRVLIMSVTGRHTITYAGIYESGTAHGTEYFEECLPLEINNQLRRLFA